MVKEFIKRYVTVLHRFRNIAKKMKSAHLPHVEFVTLSCIQEMVEQNTKTEPNLPGVKISDITKRMDATKPAISKKIRSLEEKEYVKRVSDKKDKRVVYLTVTEEGRKALEESKKEITDFLTVVFQKMGSEDVEQLLHLNEKLVDLIIEELGDIEEKERESAEYEKYH
ncbi:MarR family winged helix-turn-helix transcriptional regulator [Anaeromicropila populeti]|uniref:Winged helix DNA-binding domain-containing protein n=1 Tax=Anaeromicropila populeti TaxID=37658 RepID=A0A1I6IQ29_9FIRM|nr:MarR family transcriptional regulator [Anaeromicropila populeti]SFR68857.1 Winged helix DNA-binding domain-containing protein [Anaeromicropila populeti]